MLKDCYTIGDSDGCKTSTAIESTTSNTRYTVANGDRCKTRTIIECIVVYNRHAISNIIKFNRIRDNYASRIFIMISCYYSNIIISI